MSSEESYPGGPQQPGDRPAGGPPAGGEAGYPSGQPYPPGQPQPYPPEQAYPPGQPYPPGQSYASGQPTPAAPYPYGSGQPYPAGPVRTDDKAVWALVSSIAGYVLCPIILHIVGWVLANQSLATIRDSGGTIGGDGMAKAARVLSIVGLVVYGVGLLIGVFFLILGLTAIGTAEVSTGVST